MKRSYVLLLLLSFAITVHAQTIVLQVPPPATGEGIRKSHGPHLAVYNSGVTSRHKLVVMIPGTGAGAMGLRVFDSCFAGMGFHVISLDYLNAVITTVCSVSPNKDCFDNFRQEIVFGTPVSDTVNVDSANSIVTRLSKLLVYLVKNDPSGGWDEFLSGSQPRWSNIITAGHSQGAGHAAYLGKSFPLAGVLLFSGPQDYLEYFKTPAPWQSRKGKTPPSRYLAFLHVRDPFHYNYQIADVTALTGRALTDTTMVFPGQPVRSAKPVLVNNMETNNPHGSTLDPVFIAVWRFMADQL